MDETIPELHPLPKEEKPARRRFWPFRRKRDCRVQITLEQIRFSSENMKADSNRWHIVVAVGEEMLRTKLAFAPRDVQTAEFRPVLTRPDRCGADVDLTWTLLVELDGNISSGQLSRRMGLDPQHRRYGCPGHKDGETFTLRAVDPADATVWYQFEFQFRIELSCS